MRLRTVLAATVAMIGFHPITALATPHVEIINTPLEVEVVNPPPPSPPSRFQLVGFTSPQVSADRMLGRECRSRKRGTGACFLG